MKISKLLIPLFLLQALTLSGQKDQEALKILDRFSSVASSAPSISMKFRMSTFDQTENRKDTLSGSIILSKNKYRLDMPDNIVWFNGENSWSYLTAEKEVTISKPDRKDNSFQNKPSAIFTLYKSGYKYRLIEEGTLSYTIDLYPEDINTDMLRVRLVIGKSNMDLKSLEYKKKEGVIITLDIINYNLSLKPSADTFIFHPEKFKDAELIDVR